MTHHFVTTSSLRIQIFLIDKFYDFSSDIDFNTKIDICRDVISLIIKYSRLSLTRTPRDRGDLYSLSGVRINRSTYIATFVQNI